MVTNSCLLESQLDLMVIEELESVDQLPEVMDELWLDELDMEVEEADGPLLRVYPVIQPLLFLCGTPPDTGATGLQTTRF